MYNSDWLQDYVREFPLIFRNASPVKKVAPIPIIPKKQPKTVSKWSKIRSGLQDLFMEFCGQSTIHGISYIGSQRRSLLEKSWWTVVFLASMYGCAKLIEDMYHKWDEHPVIVTFDEKATPVWAVPFPAVTICPETKIVRSEVNFTELFYRFARDGGKLNGTELNSLLAALQLCDEWFFVRPEFDNMYDGFEFSENIVEILHRISVKTNDTIYDCRENGISCKKEFAESLTEEGICLTFNGLNSEEMFRKENTHSDYGYSSEMRNGDKWSLENGYSEDSDLFAYPFRGLGSGFRAGMYVQLMTARRDLECHCRESQGFKVLLHSPSDYPQVSTKFIRVTSGRDITVAVQPQIIGTDEDLYGYEPTIRQCFFNRERQLKFFRVYSQPNCELECLTNFTLLQCGCVPYWMPRTSRTRYCETHQIKCSHAAQNEFMVLNAESQIRQMPDERINCNCLPACNSIQYDAEITQNIYNFKDSMKARLGAFNISYEDLIENKLLSKLDIYFKDLQFITSKRTELVGMTDFIAGCGGILGLCMGVSLLSLVELLYFCSIRPFMLIRKTFQRKVTIFQVKESQ